jgi:hypothetical protein
MRQPFAQIALVDAGFGSELGDCHRAPLVQGLVKAQGVADANERNARRTAEIGQHLSDELVQFCFVDQCLILPGFRG